MQFMKASIIFLLTIFSLSALISTPAKGELTPVKTTENNDEKLYIDTDSITSNKNFVEASVKVKFKTPLKSGTSSSAIKWKVNCSSRSYMHNGFNSYDLNGSFLWGDREPTGWSLVQPGAVNEDVYNLMCNQSRR